MPRKKVRVTVKEEIAGQAMARDYFEVFQGNPAGQRILVDLQSRFEHRESHVPGDPFSTAHNEGKRSVMLFVYKQIAAGQGGI